jgi:ankyrin repeat protein
MASELVWSIKNGDLDQVKQHLDSSKTDVNSSIDGRPLILYASDYGQREIIQFLIEQGADVNAVDKHKISALLAAIWEGHGECVKLLLEKGADKSGKTPDGQSYVEAAETDEIKSLLQ